MSTISASTTSTTAYKVTADTTGTLVLQTGASPTTAVTIDGSQNVGVGITPNAWASNIALQLTGPSLWGSSGVSHLTTNTYFDGTNYKYIASNYVTDYYQLNGTHVWRYAASGTAGANVTLSEAMRIDSSGNLLVGTTVSPVANRTNGVSMASSGFKFRSPAGNNEWGIGSTSGVLAYLYSDNGTTYVYAGNISLNGNTASYNSVSDYRLKENITPMTGALDKVALLKPVTYTFKNDGQASQGFIAHELQEVIPEAVTGEKDAVDADGNPVYQGIDTSFLVATLTAAIQELKAELDAAKADIATLKGAA